MRRVRTLLVATLVASLALSALAPVASAHASKTSADGRIKVTWGWTSEPATTDAKNGLDLAVRYAENNTGVEGVHQMDVQVTLKYGDETLTFERIQPQHGREQEGRYTGPHPVTPSRPGLYVLHVQGTIDGSPVDLEVPANHEVGAIEDTYFPPRQGAEGRDGGDPELAAKVAALEQRVAALEAEAQTQSGTPAGTTPQTGGAGGEGGNATPAFGAGTLLGALAAVALALALRRRA